MGVTKEGHKDEIQLYEGPAPCSEHWNWNEESSNNNSIGLATVFNVVNPSLTVFRPVDNLDCASAIIICPGGGFHFLAIEHEGFAPARLLANMGITVFVLKYRLFGITNDNPYDEMVSTPDKKAWDKETLPVIPLAVADAGQAIKYVREHALEFGISPARIGIMGFSAGGLLAVAAAFENQKEARPDFMVAAYPDIPTWPVVTPTLLPPSFFVCATDDELGFPAHVINLYMKWFQAGRPAELHIYGKGGHGFGVGNSMNSTENWLNQLVKWLKSQVFES